MEYFTSSTEKKEMALHEDEELKEHRFSMIFVPQPVI